MIEEVGATEKGSGGRGLLCSEATHLALPLERMPSSQAAAEEMSYYESKSRELHCNSLTRRSC